MPQLCSTQINQEPNGAINKWFLGGFGAWFGILGVPLGNDPFHKMILGILTTDPNNQFTVG